MLQIISAHMRTPISYFEMATSGTKPGIKEAVGLTTQAIDRRAAFFHNIVIAIVGVSLIAITWAARRQDY